MIPRIFSYAIAQRCAALMNQCLPVVSSEYSPEMSLTTTFALTMAMPLIIIPLERMVSPDNAEGGMRRESAPEFVESFTRGLEGPFRDAPFRRDTVWYESSHPDRPREPARWSELLDPQLKSQASCSQADDQSTLHVMKGLRHALAHGCVAYLDAEGNYVSESVAEMLAFASEDRENGSRRTFIRAVSQDDFVSFLLGWAEWLETIGCGHDTSFWSPMQSRAAE